MPSLKYRDIAVYSVGLSTLLATPKCTDLLPAIRPHGSKMPGLSTQQAVEIWDAKRNPSKISTFVLVVDSPVTFSGREAPHTK